MLCWIYVVFIKFRVILQAWLKTPLYLHLSASLCNFLSFPSSYLPFFFCISLFVSYILANLVSPFSMHILSIWNFLNQNCSSPVNAGPTFVFAHGNATTEIPYWDEELFIQMNRFYTFKLLLEKHMVGAYRVSVKWLQMDLWLNGCIILLPASSKHIDESFQMCNFKDDPLPLGNKIRSKDMKILLRE